MTAKSLLFWSNLETSPLLVSINSELTEIPNVNLQHEQDTQKKWTDILNIMRPSKWTYKEIFKNILA